jgi:hypothetical protein
MLEIWTAKAMRQHKGKTHTETGEDELAREGRSVLASKSLPSDVEVLGENMENSHRRIVILKPQQAWHAYMDMLHYYAAGNLLTYVLSKENATVQEMDQDLKGKRETGWVNLGGQVMLSADLEKLSSDIGSGTLASWKEIHERYDRIWEKYQSDKQKHAYATLCYLLGTEKITQAEWKAALNRTLEIQQYISDQVYISRKKDFDNPFRHTTFRNKAEMTAAIGSVEDNSFILQVRRDTKKMEEEIKALNSEKLKTNN